MNCALWGILICLLGTAIGWWCDRLSPPSSCCCCSNFNDSMVRGVNHPPSTSHREKEQDDEMVVHRKEGEEDVESQKPANDTMCTISQSVDPLPFVHYIEHMQCGFGWLSCDVEQRLSASSSSDDDGHEAEGCGLLCGSACTCEESVVWSWFSFDPVLNCWGDPANNRTNEWGQRGAVEEKSIRSQIPINWRNVMEYLIYESGSERLNERT